MMTKKQGNCIIAILALILADLTSSFVLCVSAVALACVVTLLSLLGEEQP